MAAGWAERELLLTTRAPLTGWAKEEQFSVLLSVLLSVLRGNATLPVSTKYQSSFFFILSPSLPHSLSTHTHTGPTLANFVYVYVSKEKEISRLTLFDP